MDPWKSVSEPIAREFFYEWFKVIKDHLPGFERTVEIVRNKSAKAASYRIKFMQIDTFKFYVDRSLGSMKLTWFKKIKPQGKSENSVFNVYGQLYCF